MASSTNGATTTVTELPPNSPVDDDRYRPKASTAKVHAQIEEGLREIVAEAATQLVQFMHLTWADRKAGTRLSTGMSLMPVNAWSWPHCIWTCSGPRSGIGCGSRTTRTARICRSDPTQSQKGAGWTRNRTGLATTRPFRVRPVPRSPE